MIVGIETERYCWRTDGSIHSLSECKCDIWCVKCRNKIDPPSDRSKVTINIRDWLPHERMVIFRGMVMLDMCADCIKKCDNCPATSLCGMCSETLLEGIAVDISDHLCVLYAKEFSTCETIEFETGSGETYQVKGLEGMILVNTDDYKKSRMMHVVDNKCAYMPRIESIKNEEFKARVLSFLVRSLE